MCLTPRKPLVLYENGKFVNQQFKKKYLPMIKNKLKGVYMEEFCLCEDVGELRDIRDIIKITKKEIRYKMGEGPGLYKSSGEPWTDGEA